MSMHSLRSFRNGFVSREQKSRNQHKVAGVNSKPQKNTHLPSKKRLCKMRCDKKHVVCLPQGRILYEPQTTFKQHKYKMNEKEKKNNMLSVGNVTYNYRFGIRRSNKKWYMEHNQLKYFDRVHFGRYVCDVYLLR